LVYFIALEVYFSVCPLAKEWIDFVASVVVVGIVDAKVTEHFAFLRFDSKLWVAKNDEKLVIGDSPFVFLHFESHPVPDTDYQSETRFDASWTDSLSTIAGHISSIDSLSNEDDVFVLVYVSVRIDLVQRVKSVEKASLSDRPYEFGQSINQVQSFFGSIVMEYRTEHK
jgi:hypothetical protein